MAAFAVHKIDSLEELGWDPLEIKSHVDTVAKRMTELNKNDGNGGPAASAAKTKVPPLLRLPVDILRLIIKKLTHTNDLTSFALVNRHLYELTLPFIYSRFDIVWPVAQVPTLSAKGVDSLTHGITTLCLANSFSDATHRFRPGQHRPNRPNSAAPMDLARRLGGRHTEYTRKFSIGNGPTQWVSEYYLWKPSGKLLGTLVALAVQQMVNLNSFRWDMPTGVSSDVFAALSSLVDHSPDGTCKLNDVHVRWHDRHSSPVMPGGSPETDVANSYHMTGTLTPIGYYLAPKGQLGRPAKVDYKNFRAEYPTFSVLPPLKSLSVVNIDELSYLDEMSVLIERSKDTLRDLRVGISRKAISAVFVQTWDGPDLHQVDHQASWPGDSNIRSVRLGGVLGVLVGRVYDLRQRPVPEEYVDVKEFGFEDGLPGDSSDPASDASIREELPNAGLHLNRPGDSVEPGAAPGPKQSERPVLTGKLKLRTLELERVPLSVQVFVNALDWSGLTDLTILGCPLHENLWKVLRKQFHPTPSGSRHGRHTIFNYQLSLRKLHTDRPSNALLNFLKETLAPNTLEALFLQDHRDPPGVSPVRLEDIIRGPIRRHRGSLQKLLLDSCDGLPDTPNYRSWLPSSDHILYLTSGKLEKLRELSINVTYRDWHIFLQRLPNTPQLRALHIIKIIDISGSIPSDDAARQVVDVVSFRPELRIAYVAIGNKCFEVVESRNPARDLEGALAPSAGVVNVGGGGGGIFGGANVVVAADDSTDDDDDDDDDDDNDDDDDGNGNDDDMDDGSMNATAGANTEDTVMLDTPGSEDSDADEETEIRLAGGLVFRLRPVPFPMEKIEIFKARQSML